MNRLRHPGEVRIDPINPGIFREVLENAGEASNDQWPVFADHIERGRQLLTGRTIWNVNSTATGGGVAEMLQSLMAYAMGGRVDARWVAVSGTPEFFRVTKRLHNMLHGNAGDEQGLTSADQQAYETITERNASGFAAFVQPTDIVVLHDPQTAGMIPHLKRTGARIVWRSHIGTEFPNETVYEAWDFLKSYALEADALVFSRYSYVPPVLREQRVAVISPSIDPFSPKNQPLLPGTVLDILNHVGLVRGSRNGKPVSFEYRDGGVANVRRPCKVVREGGPPDADTPLVVQVSRWDRLKIPIGVMRGFLEQANGHGDAHLLLAGPSVEGVADDPEGAEVYAEAISIWESLDPHRRRRVHLACLPMDDLVENAAIVNALQRHACVVVQKSIREGFGLTVTEAMWKSRAVVASNLGGISKQIQHDFSGLLVNDPHDAEEFAGTLHRVLTDESLAQRLGDEAYRQVLRKFLHSHHLIRWIALLEQLIQ